MKSIARVSISALAAAALATAALAASHGGSLPLEVKARQGHMTLYQLNAGALFGMAQEKIPYDAEAAAAAASNLAALAKLNQSAYWQEGTDSDSLEGTRALPALWDDIPRVIEISQSLSAAADTMAASAGDGLDAVKANIGAVGKACSDCHEAYRQSAN